MKKKYLLGPNPLRDISFRKIVYLIISTSFLKFLFAILILYEAAL